MTEPSHVTLVQPGLLTRLGGESPRQPGRVRGSRVGFEMDDEVCDRDESGLQSIARDDDRQRRLGANHDISHRHVVEA